MSKRTTDSVKDTDTKITANKKARTGVVSFTENTFHKNCSTTDTKIITSTKKVTQIEDKNTDYDTDGEEDIPVLKWPLELRRLEKIHFSLNSYFSFLLTRNHIIPTFDVMSPNVEKSTGSKLTMEDLAKIRYFIPKDLLVKYIDEDQMFHIREKLVKIGESGEFVRKDVDMFKLKEQDNGNNQVLLIEFIDGNPMKSRANENFKMKNFNFPYNSKTLKKTIEKRNEKFKHSVLEFVKKHRKEGEEQLIEILKKEILGYIVKKTIHLDPIELMKMKNKDGNLSSTDRPSISEIIEDLQKEKTYNNQIVPDGQFTIDAKKAMYGELSFELPPEILFALSKVKKVDHFYSHQAEALNAIISQGKHVIVTTSTSSGKSLIYQIPAMKFMYDYLLLKADDRANIPTAMYIFPTKALAQDQKRSLVELFAEVGSLSKITVETYDGDTPNEERKKIRQNAKIIFTNPDMLHANILPGYGKWRGYLRNLKIIVIDELHVYRGLFGSNVAMVIRRLRRICHYLGNNDVQFISCSATLKEPFTHMRMIFGIDDETPIELVDKDGAPAGEKHLVVWNPPVISSTSNERESFITETAKLLIYLVKRNIKTICFCVVRRTVELVMKEIRSILKDQGESDLYETQIMSYRGGYSVADRRDIELQMFNGNLKAIIATNALELGIDIGVLDSVLICGFPISISNFHQQSGRAGRRNKDSLTLYVGTGDPVNQHYMQKPKLLIERNFQELVLDYSNTMIMENHLQCAAFEIPIQLDKDEIFFANNDASKEMYEKIVTTKLVKDQYGSHAHPRYMPWPPKMVSLRGIEENMFAVVDITNNRNVVIEEIEESRTSFTLYEEGIMIHQGLPYIVREFNPEEHYAKVERVTVDWITKQRDFTDVDPYEIEKIKSQEKSDVPIYFGKIKTTISVFGFFKTDKRGKILDSVDVNNPPVVIMSKGLWIDIPRTAIDIIHEKNLNIAAGIHGAEHAIINVLPLVVVTAVEDISTECKAPEKEFAERQSTRVRPARLIFTDTKGGPFGLGLLIKVFENVDDVLNKAFEQVFNCSCELGCPECVAGLYCKENSLVISKSAAIIILAAILNKKIDFSMTPNGPERNLPSIGIETIQPVGLLVDFSADLEIIE